jgi:hypothetical protein
MMKHEPEPRGVEASIAGPIRQHLSGANHNDLVANVILGRNGHLMWQWRKAGKTVQPKESSKKAAELQALGTRSTK